MSRKPKLIIVEGAQGTGKTSITLALKNRLPYAQVMMLRGNEQRCEQMSFRNHMNALKFVSDSSRISNDFILDRSFLSEHCYSQLYRESTFTHLNDVLVNFTKQLKEDYDVSIVLMLADEESFKERLVDRDKAQFSDVVFHVNNSLRQQDTYISIVSDVAKHFNVICKMNTGLKDINTLATELMLVL
jgi:thymidylate kinase